MGGVASEPQVLTIGRTYPHPHSPFRTLSKPHSLAGTSTAIAFSGPLHSTGAVSSEPLHIHSLFLHPLTGSFHINSLLWTAS